MSTEMVLQDDAAVAGTVDRFELFGVSIATPDMPRAVEMVLDLCRRDSSSCEQVAFVNADCMNASYSDWAYKRTLDACAHIFADGQGLRIAARVLGQPRPDNVNGTDMFPLLCEASASDAPDAPSLYLLGGGPGIAQGCADRMREQFPGVRIVGARDGYFEELSEEEVLQEIDDLRPDILLVGMGAPLQEFWIAQHRHRFGARVAMGVGGLFDFYSGRVRRAPLKLRRLGFEWVWRLLMEPHRLFRRYVLGNPLFLSRLLRERRDRSTDCTAADLRRRFRESERGRRQLDVLVAGVALVALLPVMALAALLIRLDSKGPVFFVQERVGCGGTRFRLWKLRTMRIDAEARKAELMARNEMQGGVLFKMKDDPRVTRIGRTLRKYSIDELPQLWNILRGEMSVAGPRPALPAEVANYSSAACERLRVRPGLTGLWQISGRSSLPFEVQARLDIENVARRSEGFDTRLMVRTAPAVIRGSGAW